MSEQTIQAIYHEGVFHPKTPDEVILHEGDEVELSIKKIGHETETETERAERIARIQNLIEHFYDGVADHEIDEIERAILHRVNFVGPEKKAEFD